MGRGSRVEGNVPTPRHRIFLVVGTGVTDLAALVRRMKPHLHDGVYVFATLPWGMDPASVQAIATMREREGWTVVLEESAAERAGLAVLFRAAWITLGVASDLHAVGFTAAFAAVLAEAGIACNVIAGAHHDHVFVPVDLAQPALARLCALQEGAAETDGG